MFFEHPDVIESDTRNDNLSATSSYRELPEEKYYENLQEEMAIEAKKNIKTAIDSGDSDATAEVRAAYGDQFVIPHSPTPMEVKMQREARKAKKAPICVSQATVKIMEAEQKKRKPDPECSTSMWGDMFKCDSEADSSDATSHRGYMMQSGKGSLDSMSSGGEFEEVEIIPVPNKKDV